MVFRTHKYHKSELGMTFVDILVSLGILMIIFSAVLMIINPLEFQKKARDNKRLSGISNLDRAIGEYVLDKKTYPDVKDVTRTSNSLPSGNLGPYANALDGWIDSNLAQYLPSIPVDPTNDTTYHYTYRHSDYGYELNAVMEYYAEYGSNDGGSDVSVYEVGNDLTIL
jgi:type II secretory pathway pseudopilin PulG